jgi:ubiquinone/menaquinone biosynthesis C-methylase UbiE
MSDFRAMYFTHATQYDALIACADYQGNLCTALTAIRSFEQADIVEWGAGTGRLTLMAASAARSIFATDRSAAMLDRAAAKLRAFDRLRWHVAVADHQHVPVSNRSADLVLAGWTLPYLLSPYEQNGHANIARVMADMQRVLRPSGVMIIIDTLGTGFTMPQIVSPELGDYFAYLEREYGFQRTWVRTDYRFASVEEAVQQLEWFFGAELTDRVKAERWLIVPECTGIWWKAITS